MSFNRRIYDVCDYNKSLAESTSTLTYILDPSKYYHCNQCRVPFGIVGGNDVSMAKHNLVDVESDLFGVNRAYSQCPQQKYLPEPCGMAGDCKCSLSGKFHLPECSTFVKYKPRIKKVGYKLEYPNCSTPGYNKHKPKH